MNNLFNQLDKNASIVILTGAGISAESGLATFRASDGLWENHRVEDVATPEAFTRDPDLVHNFYNMRRQGVKDVHPNPAHKALADLEKNWDGEVLKVFCTYCARSNGNEHAEKLEWFDDLSQETPCPSCAQKQSLRPDIVWFGEMPYYMEQIFKALENCDLFISIGTSGNVYPAAGFVQHAKTSGALSLECNLEPSNISGTFDDHIIGPAGQTIPQLVEKLLYLKL